MHLLVILREAKKSPWNTCATPKTQFVLQIPGSLRDVKMVSNEGL